jgi:hypothetical protein
MTIKSQTDRGVPARCTDGTAHDADLSTDTGLRTALARIADEPALSHGEIWEEIGAHVLIRADRDARRWHRHAAEFIGAYVLAAFELLKLRPERVLGARTPWGVVVGEGRRAGVRAVGLDMTCGMTARDDKSHRVRLSLAPRVVSLEAITESTEFALTR